MKINAHDDKQCAINSLEIFLPTFQNSDALSLVFPVECLARSNQLRGQAKCDNNQQKPTDPFDAAVGQWRVSCLDLFH